MALFSSIRRSSKKRHPHSLRHLSRQIVPPRKLIFLICFLSVSHELAAQEVRKRDPEKIHDPSQVLKEDGRYYFFSTGRGISLVQEQPDARWLPIASAFERENLPAWHQELVPANRGYLWAPDLLRIGETYFLYYSVSSFGKQRSAIGLLTGKTLNPKSPQWKWEDQGPIITSDQNSPFNAIDPAIFRDDDGSLWMTWGSFWNGLYLAELHPETGKLLHPQKDHTQIAWAPKIEAPFLHRQEKYYYLFVNHGLCCRGLQSTYEIRVGRSQSITGPYLDQEGKDLREAGGTILLESHGNEIGPGHASILRRNDQEFLCYHYYSKNHRGASRFSLRPLVWKNGWPWVNLEGSQ